MLDLSVLIWFPHLEPVMAPLPGEALSCHARGAFTFC